MKYQLTATLLYLALLIPTVLFIGKICYQNGKLFISFYSNEIDINNRVNYLLLVCYYLVIIGMLLYRLASWENISSWQTVFEKVSKAIGQMILIIGGLHIINLLSIQTYISLLSNTKH